MYFYDPSARETKELAPGVNARTFWGDKMLVSVVDLAPNTPLPEHSHSHEQVGTVLAGKVEFTIAGESRMLGPGDLLIIPGDVPHSARTFDEGARVMDVFNPIREDLKY